MASPDLERAGGIEPPASDIGQPAPQLVKQASLTLVLTDIDGAIAQVQTQVQQSQEICWCIAARWRSLALALCTLR